MKKLNLKSTDNEIISFFTLWIQYLIENGIDKAIDSLDEPFEEGRVKLKSEFWHDELDCYGDNWKITDPTKVVDLRKDVYRYDNNSGFGVDYDLPINNERSDHTLQFDCTLIDGELKITLDDLHVL